MERTAFTSSGEFLNHLAVKARAGETRSLEKDSALFLYLEGVDFTVESEKAAFGNKPTLVVINHYARPLWQRLKPTTTRESMRLATLVTHALEGRTERKTSWIVQQDPFVKIASFDLRDARTQQAIIDCYQCIGVSKSQTRHFPLKKFLRTFSGRNIGIVPEGKPAYEMQDFSQTLSPLLDLLAKLKVDYQILPVAVYDTRGHYTVSLCNPILPDETYDAAKETAMAISQRLEQKRRSRWQIPAPPLPANGRKL
jgi:hypothetical protein